ncbi:MULTISPECIES: hypothetical protein [Enterobacter cloacae complex]|uniref:Uncharacterized protein n=1 Tax=Enterobacter asburiae TaxID=61645 RepID=A0A7W3DFS0_ENTAS|nr:MULTISPECIES: hypothetical protein [Enterobacteriaceae]ECD6077968.1 hypothetical protein [Salmonella enterica subsp. enterica serovar Cotham]MBA7987755.1 hypothetical protein [Enterobacter asburiae]MBA8077947.1 hypothetical protein [Enterobacter asburiae]QLO03837.1 hypothetical protein HV141_09995 [Citrobacter freundii]QLP19686.1 hypothetical protein HV033_19335 [Enterobacter hormaechei]
MWTSLIKKLPWRGMLLAVAVAGVVYGLYRWGYSEGHDSAERDGNASLSQLQSQFDTYRREQTVMENTALRAWAKRYQEQVAAGHQAETDYLEQVSLLENQNQQLKEKIDDVTQRWIDEKGKSHPIECVFTRGFVRQYNAALGYDDATVDGGHAGSATTAIPGAGTAPRPPEAADAGLRKSGVSQRDVLANIIDNARQCRVWRGQINGLLDEREGLQK